MYVREPGKGVLVKTTFWLRVSASLSLLFAVGHFMGGLQNWSPVGDNPVLQLMRSVHFDVMGVNRSYLDFYMGFGHTGTMSLLLQAVLLWMLGDVARIQLALVRPMTAAILVAVALDGLISWRYIFPIPALFFLALCITLALALITARTKPVAANAAA